MLEWYSEKAIRERRPSSLANSSSEVPGSSASSGAGANDHARVLTPHEAIASGADYIVVGRPVTDSADPPAAARAVLAEI